MEENLIKTTIVNNKNSWAVLCVYFLDPFFGQLNEKKNEIIFLFPAAYSTWKLLFFVKNPYRTVAIYQTHHKQDGHCGTCVYWHKWETSYCLLQVESMRCWQAVTSISTMQGQAMATRAMHVGQSTDSQGRHMPAHIQVALSSQVKQIWHALVTQDVYMGLYEIKLFVYNPFS